MQVRVNGLVVMDIEPHIFLMQQALAGNYQLSMTGGDCVEFVLETGEKEVRYIPDNDDHMYSD